MRVNEFSYLLGFFGSPQIIFLNVEEERNQLILLGGFPEFLSWTKQRKEDKEDRDAFFNKFISEQKKELGKLELKAKKVELLTLKDLNQHPLFSKIDSRILEADFHREQHRLRSDFIEKALYKDLALVLKSKPPY